MVNLGHHHSSCLYIVLCLMCLICDTIKGGISTYIIFLHLKTMLQQSTYDKTSFYWILSGFIMMTPQLFINYKLKSVAHLPWRMLTYKALNTFIDDIFAFVIKMPTLYRIGCLRDGE